MIPISIEVSIKPEEIWEFFFRNRERLKKESVVVASNPFTGWEIFLTEKNGNPYAIPEFCGDAIYGGKECSDKSSTEELFRGLYGALIYKGVVYSSGESEEEDESKDVLAETDEDTEEESAEDIIYEREDELTQAFYDFLEVVTNCDERDKKDPSFRYLFEEVMDVIGEHFPRLYRPLLFKDINGDEQLEEYPYEK